MKNLLQEFLPRPINKQFCNAIRFNDSLTSLQKNHLKEDILALEKSSQLDPNNRYSHLY